MLWEESESGAVRDAIAAEDRVVISSLAELETEVQLRAKWLGGAFPKARYQDYRAFLASFRETAPFDFRELPGAVFGGRSNSTTPATDCIAGLSTVCT
jgi:uncharacterized protein with PIN domain